MILERKDMRKKMWIIIILLFGAIIFHFVTLDYIKTIDYSLVTKYGNYYTANKEDMLKEVVSEDGEAIYDYYSDYVVIYLRQPSGNYRFSRIQFCTDKYTFGLWNITIGTSREKVEKLMRNSKKCGVYDSYMCDDNGKLLDITTYEYEDKAREYGFAIACDDDDKVRYITIWE
ncbi:hypothetical protein [Pseudobutyrivibrio ruminis]|jgi:hypothetical protein|uniref:Uncharacterized protein n=2 Tax=Pseudobutyrivibrio TaxID=46205 RepID=A0A2G3DT59_9FIRM|nr:hypothetical protein [Pseudobutyrivibrio ruminis]PHU34070.1 hypothetical protein CSX01_11965 [Pseudobutyrivibrio ruminis]